MASINQAFMAHMTVAKEWARSASKVVGSGNVRTCTSYLKCVCTDVHIKYVRTYVHV